MSPFGLCSPCVLGHSDPQASPCCEVQDPQNWSGLLSQDLFSLIRKKWGGVAMN